MYWTPNEQYLLTGTVKVLYVGRTAQFAFGFGQKLFVPFQQVHTTEALAQQQFGYPTDAGPAVQRSARGRAVVHPEQFVEEQIGMSDVHGGQTGKPAEHAVHRGRHAGPVTFALLVVQLVAVHDAPVDERDDPKKNFGRYPTKI